MTYNDYSIMFLFFTNRRDIMKCNKCGSIMPDDALFCTECGATLPHGETDGIHIDDEPTSILPHLEEVIADNEEALSLTQHQAELLNDEPTEILGSSETIELPEPVEIPEPSPIPPAENSFDKPAPFPKQEAPKPKDPPINGAPQAVNDNSSTMKIPVQNEPYSSPSIHADQLSGNSTPPQGNSFTPPPQRPSASPVNSGAVPMPATAPVPAPMPAQADSKPKARAKVGGGRLFFASIVTFITMLILLLFSLLLAVKIGANGDIIKKRFTKLNAKTTLTSEFDGKEMSKTLYDSLGFRTATKGAADEAGFKRFMLNTNFREYAGDTAKNYLDFILDGEGKDPSITSEDFVNDFIKENKGEAVREFDYDFTDEDYDLMQKNLDKDKFSESMSVKEWSRKLGFDVDKLSYATSYITIGIIFALFLLFLIWIAAIVRKRGRYVTGFFGSTFTIVGLIVFLAGLTIIVGSAIAFTFTHNACFYLSESILFPLAALLIIIGAAELFLGFIFRKTKNRLKKKERKAAAAQTVQ